MPIYDPNGDFLAAFPAEVSRTDNNLDIPKIGTTLMLLWGYDQHRFIYAKNLLAELFAIATIIHMSRIKKCERLCRKYISEASELDSFAVWINAEKDYYADLEPYSSEVAAILQLVDEIWMMGNTFKNWLDLDLDVDDDLKHQRMAKLKQAFDDLGVTRAVKLYDDEKYAIESRRERKALAREWKTDR
jgi:hypothetical protein